MLLAASQYDRDQPMALAEPAVCALQRRLSSHSTYLKSVFETVQGRRGRKAPVRRYYLQLHARTR